MICKDNMNNEKFLETQVPNMSHSSSEPCVGRTTWEYNVKFWKPHSERDIDQLEKARRVTTVQSG
jgi:hypothetical protein